jgi:hypothetical protein
MLIVMIFIETLLGNKLTNRWSLEDWCFLFCLLGMGCLIWVSCVLGWVADCTVQTGRVWKASWFVLFHHVVFVVIIIVGFFVLFEGRELGK